MKYKTSVLVWLLFFTNGLWGCMANLPLTDTPAPGTYRVKMDTRAGVYRRSYLVRVPKGYDGLKPLPLVVVLHGAFSKALKMEHVTGFSQLADSERFVAVYPNGKGLYSLFRHWNSGHCCGGARKYNLDDVGFLETAIDQVCNRLTIDRSRIYMVGISNGGMMTYRFAAERSNLVAAAAVVSGTIGGKPSADEPEWRIPAPSAPMPLIVFHGRKDQSIPYEGGQDEIKRAWFKPSGRTWISVKASVSFWVKHNGCNPQPKEDRLRKGRILRQTWSGGKDGSQVILTTIEDWGHRWPGHHFTDELENDPLRGYDATEIIWQFFQKYKRDI